MVEKATLTFWSGVGVVTGANFLLELSHVSLLVDCGLVQGQKYGEDENRKPFEYDPSKVNYLFITHAHIDHVGRIPKLVKDGFKGTIYSTPETLALARIMLADCVRVLGGEAKREGKKEIFSAEDVDHAFTLWKTIPYHVSTHFEEGFDVYLKDAGHVLGSSLIEITVNGKKIVFCGDLGNSPSPLLKDAEEVNDATYLVLDSVYGDRNHEPKELRVQKLEAVVKRAIAQKATLIIPAFSMERTQILLYELNNFVEKKIIPTVPVFVDSPMAIAVTAVYQNRPADFNPVTQDQIHHGDNIFNFPKLHFTPDSQDSRAIEAVPNPKIIIAGSGMSNGGRIVHHEQHYLPNPNNIVLLVGYQAIGTMGRALSDGAKEVVIHGEKVPVRASVEQIGGFSGHADSAHLIDFAEKTAKTVKKIFVVMGEPKASLFLVQRLRDYIGADALYPERAKKYELEF
jgi:metallo-beta-lactamase family protein